ncbi:DMT family transporter [Ferrovibrio sp.]|uniref:DMT family transporter n=1 Tax=Ferrovibrio sp. TaxID=1917215 RepID=UPI003D1303E1
MTNINRPMTALEWTLLLLLSLLWGGSFFFIGVAVKEIPPLTLVTLRVALAALMLLLILRASGIQMPRLDQSGARVWRGFIIMGLLNNAIPFSLIVWGQSHIPSGLAAVFNATTPLWAVLLAHFATENEKLTLARLAGLLSGLAGVAAMIGPAALKGLGADVWAQGAIVLAAISYATAGLYGRRFSAWGVAPMATASGQVIGSSLLLLPLALLVDQPWTLPMPSMHTIMAVLGLASISTALGYTLYFRILATAGTTNLQLVTFLIPPSAMLMGVLWLDESVSASQWLGLALIGIGLACIDGRLLRYFTRAR